MVKEKDICVEINPLSNWLLGYCRDLRHHPAQQLIANNISITLNPDDYFCWDEDGVTMDYFLACVFWNFDLKDLKWCIMNSIKYSSFGVEEKKEIEEKF